MTAAGAELPNVERLLVDGDAYYRERQYELAKEARLRAFTLAGDGSSVQAHAASGLAASLDRLGEHSDALFYAQSAVQIHDRLRWTDGAEAIREFRASSGVYGQLLLKQALFTERDTFINWNVVDRARDHLADAINGPDDDQYTINFVGRHAILLAMYGKRSEARAAAKRAWQLGKVSELPDHPYSNRDLIDKQRNTARRRAMGRAAAAYALNVLAPKPYQNEGPGGPPRFFARRAALRFI